MDQHDLYEEDLARIHIEGFGFHWSGAAPEVLRWFARHGITQGKVVDLGCGGGEWLGRLAAAGYDVCGVDVSASMIRAAKRCVPTGSFIRGSFDQVDLPACDAVTSLGEPINYLDNKTRIRRVFRKVFAALRPGGLFVFDAREPADGPIAERVTTRLGDTWACIAVIREDHRTNRLTRDITTFCKVGKSYRRSSEVHRLRVYPLRDTLAWLRQIGFRVRCTRGYGDYILSPRQSVFIARKPA